MLYHPELLRQPKRRRERRPYVVEKKIYAKNIKAKRIKMLLNIIANVFLRDVRVIGCTLKVIVSIKQL